MRRSVAPVARGPRPELPLRLYHLVPHYERREQLVHLTGNHLALIRRKAGKGDGRDRTVTAMGADP